MGPVNLGPRRAMEISSPGTDAEFFIAPLYRVSTMEQGDAANRRVIGHASEGLTNVGCPQ